MTEATSTTETKPEKPTGGLDSLDFLRTLDGYEEEKIEAVFRRDVDELPFGRQLRALVFVMRLRGGMEPPAAYREAMGLSVHDVFENFPDLAIPTPAEPSPAESVEQDDAETVA